MDILSLNQKLQQKESIQLSNENYSSNNPINQNPPKNNLKREDISLFLITFAFGMGYSISIHILYNKRFALSLN